MRARVRVCVCTMHYIIHCLFVSDGFEYFMQSTIHVLRAVTSFNLLSVSRHRRAAPASTRPHSTFVRIPRIRFVSRPRPGRIRDLSTFSSTLRYFQLYRALSRGGGDYRILRGIIYSSINVCIPRRATAPLTFSGA